MAPLRGWPLPQSGSTASPKILVLTHPLEAVPLRLTDDAGFSP